MPDEARATGNVRLAACYPLVPYSNRIRDARLRFGNADHALTRNFGDHPHAIHGVGWQRAWRIERATGASAVIAYDHVAQGDDARAWPTPAAPRASRPNTPHFSSSAPVLPPARFFYFDLF